MADRIQTYNPAGVLIQQWDDGTSTYTEYDGTTGAQTLTRAYVAAETNAATQRTNALTARANYSTILSRMQTAISNNQTYLAIASPTNAQVVSQVAALTRQNDGIMKVLANLLGDLNGA